MTDMTKRFLLPLAALVSLAALGQTPSGAGVGGNLGNGVGEDVGGNLGKNGEMSIALDSISLEALFPSLMEFPRYDGMKWRSFRGGMAINQVSEESRTVKSGKYYKILKNKKAK